MKALITAIIILLLCISMTSCKSHAGDALKVLSEGSQEDPTEHSGITRANFNDDPQSMHYRCFQTISGSYPHVISMALLDFYITHGYYPHDERQFLEEGGLFVWPACPQTGEPFKLAAKVEPVSTDYGKISYIRESDNNAHFEMVSYNVKTDEYYIMQLPFEEEIAEIQDGLPEIMNAYNGDPKNSERFLSEGFDAMFMYVRSSTFAYADCRSGGAKPSTEDGLFGNYFWIKEKMLPSFASSDSNTPYFSEFGYAELQGFPVRFESDCTWFYPENRPKYIRNYKYIEPLRSTQEFADAFGLTPEKGVLDPNKYWNQLTNKQYYYSTAMLKDGSLKLPDEVVVSIDEILAN